MGITPKAPLGPSPQRAPKAPLGPPPLGSHLIPLGPIALVSRNDTVASRVLGGGAGIARACKQVGGYARSVDESDFFRKTVIWAESIQTLAGCSRIVVSAVQRVQKSMKNSPSCRKKTRFGRVSVQSWKIMKKLTKCHQNHS